MARRSSIAPIETFPAPQEPEKKKARKLKRRVVLRKSGERVEKTTKGKKLADVIPLRPESVRGANMLTEEERASYETERAELEEKLQGVNEDLQRMSAEMHATDPEDLSKATEENLSLSRRIGELSRALKRGERIPDAGAEKSEAKKPERKEANTAENLKTVIDQLADSVGSEPLVIQSMWEQFSSAVEKEAEAQRRPVADIRQTALGLVRKNIALAISYAKPKETERRERLTQALKGTESYFIRNTEDYLTLKEQLSEIVSKRDPEELNDFVSDLTEEKNQNALGMQEAAAQLLQDMNAEEILEDFETPTLQELTERSKPTAEAARQMEEKKREQQETVESHAERARKGLQRAKEEKKRGEKITTGYVRRTREMMQGPDVDETAREAINPSAPFTEEEEAFFEQPELGEWKEAVELAEAMGTENITEVIELLAEKVELGKRLEEKERAVIDEAHERGFIPWNAERLSKEEEKLTELEKEVEKERKKSWRNRVGFFSSKEMKDASKALEEQAGEIQDFQEKLEALGQQTRTLEGRARPHLK